MTASIYPKYSVSRVFLVRIPVEEGQEDGGDWDTADVLGVQAVG